MVCFVLGLPAKPQIQNLDVEGRVPDEYLIVLKESSVDTGSKLQYVDDFVGKLKAISEEIHVVKKLVALKSPALLIKVSDKNLVLEAAKLPEVKVIEANALNVRGQQCTIETATDYYGLGRISNAILDPR